MKHNSAPPYRELLLESIIADDPAVSLNAWLMWKESFGTDLELHKYHRLLPLVYQRLQGMAYNEPCMDTLKWAYERSERWNRNVLQLGEGAIKLLQDRHIDVILLKGAALLSLGLADAGGRFLSDIDLLVRPEQRDVAVEALSESGFRVAEPTILSHPDFSHSVTLGRDGDSHTCIDLHTSLSYLDLDPRHDNSLWQRKTPIEFQGRATFAPDVSDLLLNVTLHGAGLVGKKCYWVVDALSILRSDTLTVDWDYFLKSCGERKLRRVSLVGLRYLSKFCKDAIPREVLLSSTTVAISAQERVEALAESRPVELIFGQGPGKLLYFFRLSPRVRAGRQVKSFIHFTNYLLQKHALRAFRPGVLAVLHRLARRMCLAISRRAG